MRIGERFLGRDREVAQLELAIGPGNDGLRLAMLTGPSGLGKTTLSRVVMDRTAHRGFRVALANGRAGSLSTPFMPWIEAMPELEGIIAEAGSGAGVDMEQLGVQLVRLLTESCETQPMLLVFDDAQALDESSLALLPYAVGVSERLNLTIMIIEQNDAVGIPDSYRAFVDGLVARRVVQHLELGPMSDESIGELVRAVLELDEAAAIPTEVVLRAQGNPWFAQELADAWRRGDSEIPVNIAAAATARLMSLGETAQDLVSAVALCPEGAYIGWLEQLADEKPRVFARTMEAIMLSGLVREDGDIISIAHPLMQQALLDELSAAMKRALHQELADAVEATPMAEVSRARALGYHISQTGKPDEAVAHFLVAAEANEVLGQLHEALADYVRALDAEPRIDQRVHLLKRCAFASTQVGNERAFEYWTELARIAAAREDNETYAYALFQQYWCDNDGASLARLERAASLGSDRYGWSARAAATIATLEDDTELAIGHDTRALELARAAGDTMLEALTLGKLASSYVHAGRLQEAVDASRQAVAFATSNRYHGWVYTAWNTLTYALVGSLDTERAILESRSVVRYVQDLDLRRFMPSASATLAHSLLDGGRVEEALQASEQALMLERSHPGDTVHRAFTLWTRLVVAIESGDVTLAQALLDDTVHAVEEVAFESWRFEVRFATARLMALRGDMPGAVQVARELQINEETMATVILWLMRSAVAHDDDSAIELATSLREQCDPHIPLFEMMLRECDAILAARSTGDVAALQHVVGAWEASGRMLDAARASAGVGLILQRAGAGPAAIAALTDARSRLAKCGATGDADRVASALRSLGTRSRARSRTTNVGTLTKRELEIARLVASGLRNAEVAAQLFLAEKTVAAHLSNIYGKLEVRSRVQLTSWLQENDVELAAS